MEEHDYFVPGESKVTTWGIRNRLDLNLQNLLWIETYMLKENGIKADHMQIFKLKTVRTRSKDTALLKVAHTQEAPYYENNFSIRIELDMAVNGTVWMIDDLTHATMMWDTEY